MNPRSETVLENNIVVLGMLNMRYMLDIQEVIPNKELDVQLYSSQERSEI